MPAFMSSYEASSSEESEEDEEEKQVRIKLEKKEIERKY